MPKQAAKPEAKQLAPRTPEGKFAADIAFNKLKLPHFPRPAPNETHYRQLPLDLSSVSGEDLAEGMSYWTAMQNYANEQIALMKNDLEAQERNLERYLDAKITQDRGDYTITEKKSRARSLPQAIEFQREVDHISNVLNVVRAIHDNCQRCYEVLSREITRRGADSE